jgi:polyhydroxyalkanoate synthase
VVNPPAKQKYQFWSDGKAGELDEWMSTARQTAGSWWPDWTSWLAGQSGPKIPARNPSNGPLWAIEDAPGSFVKARD